MVKNVVKIKRTLYKRAPEPKHLVWVKLIAPIAVGEKNPHFSMHT